MRTRTLPNPVVYVAEDEVWYVADALDALDAAHDQLDAIEKQIDGCDDHDTRVDLEREWAEANERADDIATSVAWIDPGTDDAYPQPPREHGRQTAYRVLGCLRACAAAIEDESRVAAACFRSAMNWGRDHQ